MKIIKNTDSLYPKRLLSIKNAPKQLYVEGDETLLNKQAIAIVGTRMPSEYGIKVANEFAKELSNQNYCVISGLAQGIDTYAHMGAKCGKGKTVAVLGAGFNHIYPKQNTKLYQAKIFCSDLTNANLNNATCALTDFSYSAFVDAYMINTCLEDAKFYKANLSGAIGLLDPIIFLNSKFTKTNDGYIAYKVFNCYYFSPLYWEIDENSILVENVDFDRSVSCSYGINVTTFDDALQHSRTIYDKKLLEHIPDVWKVLIKWEWLPLVVVPFNATNAFRCGKVQLLEKVKVIK